MSELEVDHERFIYEEIHELGGASYFVQVGCHHRNVEDVKMVTGAAVARLCLDCDNQLPVDGRIEW